MSRLAVTVNTGTYLCRANARKTQHVTNTNRSFSESDMSAIMSLCRPLSPANYGWPHTSEVRGLNPATGCNYRDFD